MLIVSQYMEMPIWPQSWARSLYSHWAGFAFPQKSLPIFIAFMIKRQLKMVCLGGIAD